MAIGDATDFTARLRAALPGGWFPAPPAAATASVPLIDQGDDELSDALGVLVDDSGEPAGTEMAPTLAGVLAGFASIWAFVYGVIAYVRAQARIATATGSWLDGRGADFLGPGFQRRPGEPDAVYSARVRREIMRPRVTRAALSQVILDTVGQAPTIFEPWNATDTGGVGNLGMTVGTGLEIGGTGVAGAGGIGSLLLPFQVFVTAKQSGVGGIGSVMGIYYGSGWAGGGIGSLASPAAAGTIEIASLSFATGQITDADIYDAIVSVLAAGATAWVALH